MEPIELTTVEPTSRTSQTGNDAHISQAASGREQRLEPTDRGVAAWRLLGAAFIFEALLWGFPLSFGVFQNYYSQQPAFASNPYTSVIGTVASGISYLGAPFITPLVKRFLHFQKTIIWVGWLICIAGIALASICTTVETLILTQGVTYGMGFLLFYYPILNMVNEYWITRRGMAYGLLCSASGVSGAVMPFIIQTLLDKYDYQVTLRIIAIALLVLTGPMIPLLKSRLPPSSHTAVARIDWAFIRNPLFWVYSLANIAQGLGYFLPSLYLPSYATDIGLSNNQGALLVSLMSVAQVAGQLTFGTLSDQNLSLRTLTTASTIPSAISVLTLWGLAKSLPLLLVFALVYGFFTTGYTAMWARMSTDVSDDATSTPIVFGLFNFGKGVGNVLAGPLGGKMVSSITVVSNYGIIRYTKVVIFTGSCMALSSIVIASSWLLSCL